MSVKASVSLTRQQNDFARKMVADGRYPSVSAVIQQGLEMMRGQEMTVEEERAALRALLTERMNGKFISMEEFQASTQRMLAEKRKEYGIPD